jgi:hypothetical protein
VLPKHSSKKSKNKNAKRINKIKYVSFDPSVAQDEIKSIRFRSEKSYEIKNLMVMLVCKGLKNYYGFEESDIQRKAFIIRGNSLGDF